MARTRTQQSVDWSAYSAQQINCLEALDFAVPLHQTHLTGRYGVRLNTVDSCVRLGLARLVYLYDEHQIAGIPFYTLTQFGEEVKRDWKRWNARVANKLTAMNFGNSRKDARHNAADPLAGAIINPDFNKVHNGPSIAQERQDHE